MKKRYVLIGILTCIFTSVVYGQVVTNQDAAYQRDFNGEGVVVAIIDGGSDVNHPDFKLSDESEIKLSKENVENTIKQKGLKGKYLNSKIPYIRDYYHLDNDIYSKDEHGMHVAGIVGANGKVKGVAPECQLLLMKVFPDSGTDREVESTKYYVQAIKDAIDLQADVINLSLGTGAGSTSLLDDSVKSVIKKATDLGIIVNIASGNNGYFGYTQANPKSDNPDYGVTSMPAILPESLAVASLEGDSISATMLVSNNKKYPYQVAYKESLSLANDLPYGKEVELIDVGYGMEDEYKEDDYENKIVIARRGKLSFRELQKIAAKKDALGMIIYNDLSDDKELLELEGSEFSIPVATMYYQDGIDIISNLKKDNKIVFLREKESIKNKNSGKMSQFSSWGITNEGILKPDITGPGGNILSLGNNGTYIRMSGTSMATPYISGACALAVQRLNETYDQNLPAKERFKLVKQLIMSTANKHSENNMLISPRKQGSGLVDIRGVVTGQVLAYLDETSVNLNLGNVKDRLNIPVTLHNLSNKEVVLSGSYQLLVDNVKDGRFTMTSKLIKSGNVDKLVLKPKQKKQINYTIDIKDINLSHQMKNGYFIDGFITYKYDDNKPTASLAFTSFKGDFSKLPIIEQPIYDIEKYEATYINKKAYTNDFTHFGSGILVGDEEKHIVLGETNDSKIGNRKFDKNHIAISPNNDNKADYLDFSITALRTYQKLQLDILDSNKHLVDTFVASKKLEFMKNYYGGNPKNKLALTLWKYLPKNVGEGKYFARITVQRIFGDKSSEQSYEYPFYIDNTPPILVSNEIEDDYLSLKCSDNLSGIYSLKLIIDDHEIKPEKDGRYNIKGYSKNRLKVVVKDYAYNEAIYSLK